MGGELMRSPQTSSRNGSLLLGGGRKGKERVPTSKEDGWEWKEERGKRKGGEGNPPKSR